MTMKRNQRGTRNLRQRGISIVEALVALVVIAVGMPHFASQYASGDDENFSDSFPFVTFDDYASASPDARSPELSSFSIFQEMDQ